MLRSEGGDCSDTVEPRYRQTLLRHANALLSMPAGREWPQTRCKAAAAKVALEAAQVAAAEVLRLRSSKRNLANAAVRIWSQRCTEALAEVLG